MSLQAWGGLGVLGEWDKPDAQETHPRACSLKPTAQLGPFSGEASVVGRGHPGSKAQFTLSLQDGAVPPFLSRLWEAVSLSQQPFALPNKMVCSAFSCLKD